MNAIAEDDSVIGASARLSRRIGPGAAYAIFTVAAVVSFLPSVVTMAKLWAGSSSFHHGFLIAPIVIALIRYRGADVERRASWPALALVAAFAALWLVGRAMSANLVEEIAFVGILIAGAAVAFGFAWAKAHAFPLLLLFLMVPAGVSLNPALQQIAATGAMALLSAAGVDTSIDGFLISTAAGRFEVAEGCSGLNFLLASLLIASVYAFLSMRTWRRRAMFVALGIVLALIANVLRVFLVIALATWSNGEIEIAADHLLFGWFLYGALLFGFILAGRRFADLDAPEHRARQPSMHAFDPRPLAAAIALLGTAALADQMLPQDVVPETARADD